LQGDFTDVSIKTMLSGATTRKRAEIADRREPGLRLRLGPDGATWSVMTYTLSGSRVRVPVGAWPAVGVDEARSFAGALKATFQQPHAPDEPTLSLRTLLDRYEARRLSQLRKGAVMARALQLGLADILPLEASLIGRREISAAIDDMADRAPIHANRVLAYAKAFFGWCVGRGYLDANPATNISKPTVERARTRTPSLEEVREIWRAAGTLGYPFGPITQLLILTAMRRDEIGAMRVDEFEDQNATGESCWVLPAERSKNGRAIRIPLPPPAAGIVREVRAAHPSNEIFLFTTTGRTPPSGWSRAKARLDKAIAAQRRANDRSQDMAPWRLHDLRRSFATGACDLLRIDPVVADRCLNHVGSGTTSTVSRIYGRSEMFDQRRDALRRWADLVTGVVDAAPDAV
jgi:integrase